MSPTRPTLIRKETFAHSAEFGKGLEPDIRRANDKPPLKLANAKTKSSEVSSPRPISPLYSGTNRLIRNLVTASGTPVEIS